MSTHNGDDNYHQVRYPRECIKKRFIYSLESGHATHNAVENL